MEDRPSRGMNMVSAMVAAIRRTANDAMMLGHALTLLAMDAIGVEVITQPLKAGRVIWELFHEVF